MANINQTMDGEGVTRYVNKDFKLLLLAKKISSVLTDIRIKVAKEDLSKDEIDELLYHATIQLMSATEVAIETESAQSKRIE